MLGVGNTLTIAFGVVATLLTVVTIMMARDRHRQHTHAAHDIERHGSPQPVTAYETPPHLIMSEILESVSRLLREIRA